MRVRNSSGKGLREWPGLTHRYGYKFQRIVLLAAAVVFMLSVNTQAGFSGFSGLDITAQIEFDTGFALDDGTDSYSGSFSTTVGGATTLSTFIGDGSTVTVTGANPLPAVPAVLTDENDGVGLTASVSGDDLPDDSEFGVGMDFFVKMVNSSAKTYDIFARFDFSNAVDAGGDDAYAESELTIDLDPDGPDFGVAGTEIFFTDLVSDTVFGDEKNGTDLGTWGAAVSDSGSVNLSVTLLPGETSYLVGSLTMEGLAFASDYTADFSGELSLRVIPAPGALLLASIGLGTVGYFRRRRHQDHG